MNTLINQLSQICFLTQEAKTALCDALRREWHPADYQLQKQHQPFNKIWLSVTGILHCYCEFEGEITTMGYTYPGESLIQDSFPLTMKRATVSIQALQAFSCFTITNTDIQNLINKFDCIESLFHTIKLDNYNKRLRDQAALLILPPEQRFLYILDNYPLLLTNTSKKQMSSYLKLGKNTFYALLKKHKI